MDDKEIIKLLWERSENALQEVRAKYEKYCRYIALNILKNREDADDCVNEAYLKVWNAIPPQKPDSLCAFIGKITRNLSLDLYNKKSAQKRGNGEVQYVCFNKVPITNELILISYYVEIKKSTA